MDFQGLARKDRTIVELSAEEPFERQRGHEDL